MTGIKESTWCDELWVFYATNDSLNSTPETNTTLSVTEIELKKKIPFYFHITLQLLCGPQRSFIICW